MDFGVLLEKQPYSLDKGEKEKLLTERLMQLTELHRQKCPEYKRILDGIGFDFSRCRSYRDLPFLPVRLFKELSLKSVDEDRIVKTMTSSGTTGQSVSKIYLDRETASDQQKTMVKIVSNFTGSSRMPMIIIDCPSVIKDRTKFSARGAGILGFSIFGSKKIYALDDDMKLDTDGLQAFLAENRGKKILLFGFTFMIWQHFYKELVRLKDMGISFDLSNAVMIHGGGWKKLVSEAVSPGEFHDRLKEVCGIDAIHDYYGMVEQTGCIYMQCECGHLHASIFSDVITRRYQDFSECDIGEEGILQVVSAIPGSYPGHSLLTEDEGIILGEDDCPCGRKGKYFRIIGRIKDAELRGCSDTYAAGVGRSDASSEEGGIFDRISFLAGDESTLRKMPSVPSQKPFSDDITEFLDSVSGELMHDKNAKLFPDVVTLGFWLRRASVGKLKQRFDTGSDCLRLGRGMTFHIAPSNVPVNFAYSLFTGLMCGNPNVVRVPSKGFPQVDIISRAVLRALEVHPCIRPYICLIRYDRDRRINDILSEMCSVRVVWGGNATIEELRRSPLGPRAKEITFADRYSLAVIDSDAYLSCEDKDRVASDFYNDTYLSDQNACTSPRVVVWTGNRKDEAKERFWAGMYELVSKKYELQPVQAVDKLTNLCMASVKNEGVSVLDTPDNLIVRIRVESMDPGLMDYRGNSGYFYEFDCDNIMDVREFCNVTTCQTIGFLGSEDQLKELVASGISGVDRIVRIGHTMDFDLIWDGYDLVSELTRKVSV